jgi:hypothetical protein
MIDLTLEKVSSGWEVFLLQAFFRGAYVFGD